VDISNSTHSLLSTLIGLYDPSSWRLEHTWPVIKGGYTEADLSFTGRHVIIQRVADSPVELAIKELILFGDLFRGVYLYTSMDYSRAPLYAVSD